MTQCTACKADEFPDGTSACSPCAATLAKAFQDRLDIMKHKLREQIEAVFQSFNVEALATRATSVMGKELGSVLQIAQGGYNSILAVTFTDGTDVLVRIAGSYHNSDPLSDELATLVFNSEVATLKYLKANTSIPVPQIYYSNSDPAEAGARFMIIERLNGVPLDNVWESLSHEQRHNVFAQWVPMQAELSKQRFNAIGCLATHVGDVGPLLPSCLAEYTLRKPHWGPFRSTPEFLEGQVCSVLDGLTENSKKRNFLEHLLTGIRALPREKFHNEHLVLTHGDLSLSNILYGSSGNIVGVIDWEGSSVLPVWAAFQDVDFLCWMPDETALRETLIPATEDTALPVALHPILRELLSLATGTEDPQLRHLRARVAELGASFSWISEPFLSLLEESMLS